jgi:cell wall-associated NlpC family hydrolase
MGFHRFSATRPVVVRLPFLLLLVALWALPALLAPSPDRALSRLASSPSGATHALGTPPAQQPMALFAPPPEGSIARLRLWPVADPISPRLASPVEAVARERVSAHITGALRRARSQLGTPYLLGAQQPGGAFDCSGFIQWTMGSVSRGLPRVAQAQAEHGIPLPRDVRYLAPGDLLTFGKAGVVSHVGLYLGHGRYIHASESRGVTVSQLSTREGSWWLGARRLVGPPPPPTLEMVLRGVTYAA